MKLTFNSVYQSITSFDQTEISDFAVITGLNGSGKTHLLNAIHNGQISVSGIDVSEIIFYNYNDFTIHNADPGQDKQIQAKQHAFQTKSNSFNQRLNTQRSQALNSFQLTLPIGDMTFGEYSFQHQPDLDAMLDWSEADFELYQKRAGAAGDTYTAEFIQSLNPHQTQFFQSLGFVSPLTDVRNVLKKVKAFKIEADAMNMLRSSGFNKDLSSWKPEELTAIFPEFKAAADKYHFLETQHSPEGFPLIDANLMTFLHLLLSIAGEGAVITLERCLALKSTLPELVSKLEMHLEKSMDQQILKILRQMTGGILTPIASESAFLNLHDIKQAEKQYQIQKKQNEYAGYQKNYLKQTAHHLSEADFLRQYGDSPVDTLNRVLNEYDCNGYEFRQSEIYYQFGQDVYAQNIDVFLFNKAGNYTTTLDALSSGERTLLALAFTIYKLRQRKAVARLFLMDEVDSALHPSMSKRLLHVLHRLFHQEMGINIIISTHSPSTVAFSPQDSTYVMRREQSPRLISATIDAALSELTAGVPSFSVNYENRRQVFVESPNDV
ncbi:MAG TPA: AAA family ATPase, partial [Pedobacter sp.]|uniref:AAA family ATPase n=1 Tax=Pedobacter sp. TaxID=1411316 RepID=UPI002C5B457B